MARAASAALLLVLLGGCAVPHYRENQLRALNADDASSVLNEAYSALGASRYAEASKKFSEYLAVAPNADASVFLGAAKALEGEGKRAEARSHARIGWQRSSSEAARALLLRLYAADGLFEVGLSFLSDSDGLDAASSEPLMRNELQPLADAKAKAASDDLAGAVSAYEAFLAQYGAVDHSTLRRWSDEVLVKLGPVVEQVLDAASSAERRGDHDEAVRAYAVALRLQPTGAQAPTRARLLAAFQKANATALNGEALGLIKEGQDAVAAERPGDALRSFRRAAAIAPWLPEARFNIAVVLDHLGERTEARALLDEAVALEPPAALRSMIDARLTARANAAPPAAVSVEERDSARAWRARGYAFGVAAGVTALGALTFATLGASVNGAIRGGAYDTATDIETAARLGQRYNTLAYAMLAATGAFGLAAAPMILLNREEPLAGVAVGGTLP